MSRWNELTQKAEGRGRKLLRRLRKLWTPTRGQRTAFNLLLVVLGAVWVWGVYAYPLTPEQTFRRLERQNFLEPSQIICHQKRDLGWSEEARLTRSIYVGLGEDWAVTAYVDGRGSYTYWKQISDNSYSMVNLPDSWLNAWALPTGPALIPVGFPVRGWNKDSGMGWGLAAVRLPEEAETGELTLIREEERWSAPGEKLDNGAMYFWCQDPGIGPRGYGSSKNLPGRPYWPDGLGIEWAKGLSYELALWDKNGGALPTLTGQVLEG